MLRKLGKFVSNDCYSFQECSTPALKRILYLKKASRLFSQILVCLMSILYILNNTRNIFVFGVLAPLPAICQLYHSIKQFQGWKKPEYPVRTTDHGKQLASFSTCGCESSAPFLQFTKQGANPHRIGESLYDLLGNQTT